MRLGGEQSRRRRMVVAPSGVFLGMVVASFLTAGTGEGNASEPESSQVIMGPDVRERLSLSPDHEREHRVIMLQHLEAVQAIGAGLVEEDYGRAQGIAEASLGFAKHREAMAKLAPAKFLPGYHDYAMAHHHAAEQLAQVLPSKDLKQILRRLDGVIRACVACHAEFTIRPIARP